MFPPTRRMCCGGVKLHQGLLGLVNCLFNAYLIMNETYTVLDLRYVGLSVFIPWPLRDEARWPDTYF